jgi:polysaccharide export outer membrane protein
MRLPKNCRSLSFVLLLALSGAVAIAPRALAQYPSAVAGRPYQIGVGDVLQLSVWQQPTLDRELTVRDDGTVVVPLVGEVKAAGLTVPDLENQLSRRLRSFNRDITEVSVTVSKYQSLQIYVMGAVAKPGVHSFKETPTAWDAIRAAGGPTATANLRRVRVLHTDEKSTVTTLVNVSQVIHGEGTGDLPDLSPGDTVIVPDDAMLNAADRETGVHVFGQVVKAGFYSVEGPTPVLTVILLAGGFNGVADPHKVRLVHDSGRGSLVGRKVDTTLFLENGQISGNPLVYSGDTVYVEKKPDSGGAWRILPSIVASVTGVVALLISVSRN